jgi:hypothetical protein
VGAAQHPLAPKRHGPQLDARAIGADRRGGTHRDQPPQDLAVARHGDPRRARLAHHRRLPGVGQSAAPLGDAGGLRGARVEAHDLARAEPHADDFIGRLAVGGAQTDRDGAPDAAVGKLVADDGRHRAVRQHAAGAQFRPEGLVVAQDRQRRLAFIAARKGLSRAGRDGRRAAVDGHVDEQRLLGTVVVHDGTHV